MIMKMALKIWLSVALVFILTGCGLCTKVRSRKPIVINDRVKLEVRTEYITRIDTGYFKLPKIVLHNRTRDTFSLLENEFAVSTASVSKDGQLSHTLETKDTPVPVLVPVTEKSTETKESHETQEPVVVVEEVEVEKPFSKFVKFQLWGFWILAGGNVLWLIIKYRKFFTKIFSIWKH